MTAGVGSVVVAGGGGAAGEMVGATVFLAPSPPVRRTPLLGRGMLMSPGTAEEGAPTGVVGMIGMAGEAADAEGTGMAAGVGAAASAARADEPRAPAIDNKDEPPTAGGVGAAFAELPPWMGVVMMSPEGALCAGSGPEMCLRTVGAPPRPTTGTAGTVSDLERFGCVGTMALM